MRGADSHRQGARQAEHQPECGRASQRGIRQLSGMLGRGVSVEVPESGARKYMDAIPHAKNPMRKALLHERAAICLLKEGNLDESLRQAQEAHTLFKEVYLGKEDEAYLSEAQKFRDRFCRLLRSKPRGVVAVEFFEL